MPIGRLITFHTLIDMNFKSNALEFKWNVHFTWQQIDND